jgi:hypothetical protein
MCTSGSSYRGTRNVSHDAHQIIVDYYDVNLFLKLKQGDSGGPMNYKQMDGRWKKIGIISFGSTEGCQKGHPNGYTRLSSYSSTWIKDVIETTSGTHPTTFAFLSTPLIFVSIAFAIGLSTACF